MARTSWDTFPREVRRLILQYLMNDDYPLSRIATVCREWQAEVEPVNFARIRLTPSRLVNFHSIICRNQALVRYTWFCLELEDYDCKECHLHFDPRLDSEHSTELLSAMVNATERPIICAIRNLFLALQVWEPREHLTLDISIHSPSDDKHWFPYLTFASDSDSTDIPTTGGTKQLVSHKVWYHDSGHYLVDGSRQSRPPVNAISKLFTEPVNTVRLKWWSRLPLVPAVTSVLLRQQSHRRWKPKALAHMFGRFPRLQEVHYVPWRPWAPSDGWVDLELQYLFETLPKGNKMLKKLVVFENFSQQYAKDFRMKYPYSQDLSGCEAFRKPTPAVSRAIAIASRELEHVAVSYLADATQFFKDDPAGEWPNMTSLQLTSDLLTPNGDLEDIQALLQAGAAAALRMPRLEVMEIWNGRKGVAGLLQYRASRELQQARITWRGTWRLALDPSVTQAWAKAAAKHGCDGRPLARVQEEVDGAAIKSHGDAIPHQGFSSPVLRPISLQQIQFEQVGQEGVETVEVDLGSGDE